MKFTKKEVIKAVQCVIEDNKSVLSTAQSFGMSKSVLKNYVKRARIHGYACLIKSGKNKRHSGDFKLKVVEYIKEKKYHIMKQRRTLI